MNLYYSHTIVAYREEIDAPYFQILYAFTTSPEKKVFNLLSLPVKCRIYNDEFWVCFL
jgi:hypothetical protein